MEWSFKIENIPEEGTEIKEKDSPSAFGLKDDKSVSYDGGVEVRINMAKVGKRVNVKGGFCFNARFNCARCLEPFAQNICPSFDIVYEPKPAADMKKEELLRDEEANIFYYDENEGVKLGDAIREIAIVNLPVKPLCGKQCRGLCPSCGKNLNRGPCKCDTRKTDPRFEKLKELKEREK